LMAVLGPKLQPTSQGCASYHLFACSGVQRSAAYSEAVTIVAKSASAPVTTARRKRSMCEFIAPVAWMDAWARENGQKGRLRF
jgi:hypothetical protein